MWFTVTIVCRLMNQANLVRMWQSGWLVSKLEAMLILVTIDVFIHHHKDEELCTLFLVVGIAPVINAVLAAFLAAEVVALSGALVVDLLATCAISATLAEAASPD